MVSKLRVSYLIFHILLKKLSYSALFTHMDELQRMQVRRSRSHRDTAHTELTQSLTEDSSLTWWTRSVPSRTRRSCGTETCCRSGSLSVRSALSSAFSLDQKPRGAPINQRQWVGANLPGHPAAVTWGHREFNMGTNNKIMSFKSIMFTCG